MKTINCIDCEVIKDLLPSYADKILSKTSNKLVEEHLKKCKNCSDVLKNMNKEIDNEIIENQNEQIDYLKGFKRKKIATIICVIIITILICFNLFLIISTILMNVTFPIDLNEIDTYVRREEYGTVGSEEKQKGITIDLYCKKHQILCDDVIKDEEKKELYIKVSGKYHFLENGCRTPVGVEDKENINRIYIQNQKGDVKKIWDVGEGFL